MAEEQPVRPTRPPQPTPRQPVGEETLYAKLNRLHKLAYEAINEGITVEGNNLKDQAFAKYQIGLTLIDEAVNITIKSDEFSIEECEKAADMINKMRRTRKEILIRISDVQDSAQAPLPEPPPTYDEFMRSQSETDNPNTGVASPTLPAYAELNAALWEIVQDDITAATNVEIPRGADEVFCIPENVQIFFVSPSGNVSAPSYPSALKIYVFKQNEGAEGSPSAPAFLQVGDWTYPLLPLRSPVLQSQDGSYMFPDLQSNVEGSAIGLILPPNISKEDRETFEDILTHLTVLLHQAKELSSPSEYSKQISEGLVAGASRVSQGIQYGAEKAGQWLDLGTTKLLEKIQPDPSPTQVDHKVKQSARVVRNVAGTAVQVSGFIVSRVGAATMALGRYLAPHVRKQGSKLISKVSNSDERRASQQMDNALEVAAGALQGFGHVYMGLETAAKVLATNISNNTVHIVQHKYGPDAAAVTSDAVQSVGYVAMTGYNVSNLGVKGIAKKAAKSTGKALVEDHRNRNPNPNLEMPKDNKKSDIYDEKK